MSVVHRAVAGLALALVFTTTMGCLTPFVARKGSLPETRPAPALTSGFVVANANSERSVLDAVQDGGLSEFGTGAVEPISAALAAKGYAIAFDKGRAKVLNAANITSDSTTTALTGAFHHPEASYWTPDLLGGPFVSAKDLIVKIRTDNADEFFAFVGVNIRQSGIIFKEPQVEVRVSVYDANGVKVLDLRGLGVGDSSPFIANRSPSNLKLGLSRAVASFQSLTEEAL